MNQTLIDVEENIAGRKKTDRRMWFSMWILLSFVTFGAAWFIMIYYLIKRRNNHFARQEKLEHLVLNWFGKPHSENQSKISDDNANEESKQDIGKPRRALAWTALTLLILPAFYIFRFLMEDLHKHEEHDSIFLRQIISHTKNLESTANQGNRMMMPKSFTLSRYFTLTLITLGLAGVYWLYLIFNDYNSHFKRQWALEDELLKTLKTTEKSTSTAGRNG